jgi:hypothetical protein
MIFAHNLSSQVPTPAAEKAHLVDLGIWAVNHDQMAMVWAIIQLIRSRGLAHE